MPASAYTRRRSLHLLLGGAVFAPSLAFLGIESACAADQSLTVATRTQLKAADSRRAQLVQLTETGREGTFGWDPSVAPAVHQADWMEAVYVAPFAAASGAWVRHFNGRARLEWGGFSPGNSAARNRQIMRAMLDRYPCACGPGAFPLQNFLWKSRDDFQGSGRSTEFVSASGVVMKFGCLAGDGVTRGKGAPAYRVSGVQRGATRILIGDEAGIGRFEPGGTLLLWSEAGYADTAGEFKPAYQQIVGIAGVNGRELILEEPCYRDAPSASAINATPGQTVTGREQGSDRGISRELTVGNFAVSCPNDSWMRFGGTYKSQIGPIWVIESNGAVVMNGLAQSRIEIASARIKTALVDAAVFCHSSSIVVGPWQADPAGDNRGMPLISLSEGAHDLDLTIGSGGAAQVRQRQAAIAFNQGSSRNTVRLGNIELDDAQTLIRSRRTAQGPMEYAGNTIVGGTLHVKHCANVISQESAIPGEAAPLVVSGSILRADKVDRFILLASASRLTLDCEIDAPSGGISIKGPTKQIDLRQMRTRSKPSFIDIPSGAQVSL